MVTSRVNHRYIWFTLNWTSKNNIIKIHGYCTNILELIYVISIIVNFLFFKIPIGHCRRSLVDTVFLLRFFPSLSLPQEAHCWSCIVDRILLFAYFRVASFLFRCSMPQVHFYFVLIFFAQLYSSPFVFILFWLKYRKTFWERNKIMI